MEEKIKCPFCGEEIKENAEKCPHCGEVFIKDCPFCGEKIKVEAIKCKHCGEWLDDTKYDNTEQSTIKKDVLAVICITLGMIVIILLIDFFVIKFNPSIMENAIKFTERFDNTANNTTEDFNKTLEKIEPNWGGESLKKAYESAGEYCSNMDMKVFDAKYGDGSGASDFCLDDYFEKKAPEFLDTYRYYYNYCSDYVPHSGVFDCIEYIIYSKKVKSYTQLIEEFVEEYCQENECFSRFNE